MSDQVKAESTLDYLATCVPEPKYPCLFCDKCEFPYDLFYVEPRKHYSQYGVSGFACRSCRALMDHDDYFETGIGLPPVFDLMKKRGK